MWLSPPFTLSAAHPGKEYVTTYKMLKFDAYAREAMKAIGVPIIDTTVVTRSMWESAHDGIEYRRGTAGQTAAMMFQTALNAIFPTCTG